MITQRSSGILLHPTSFPGPYGIGDLGEAAFYFVDWLAEAKQQLWQVLPLGPTGFGDSPYQCFSAFAGNPLLIAPEDLMKRGYLSYRDLAVPLFPQDRVDYGPVIQWKQALLRKAYEKFSKQETPGAFSSFVEQEKAWLHDYALFMALKEAHGGRSWNQWPQPLRDRETGALANAREHLHDIIRFHYFQQWLFFEQWSRLRTYANAKNIPAVFKDPDGYWTGFSARARVLIVHNHPKHRRDRIRIGSRHELPLIRFREGTRKMR